MNKDTKLKKKFEDLLRTFTVVEFGDNFDDDKLWSFIHSAVEEAYKDGYDTFVKVARKSTGWKPKYLKDLIKEAVDEARKEERR